jgi:hypothetical protein
MSEGSFWPRTWKEALPLIVWGILIFAAGFEGIASLVHAEWISSIASFAIMLGLTAMLLHWKPWLERINPNWVVGAAIALIMAIAVSPFVRQGQWPATSWEGVSVGVIGALIVVATVAALVSFLIAGRRPATVATSQVAVQIDGQTNLDLIHLLDFATNQSTFWLLDALLETSESPPVTDGFRDGPDTEAAHNSRQWFTGWVRQQIGAGTHRHAEYLDVLQNSEIDAERQLQATPQTERPSDIDLLTLRRYRISELQFRRTVHFINHQKREIREKIVHQRHSLIQRLQQRNDRR